MTWSDADSLADTPIITTQQTTSGTLARSSQLINAFAIDELEGDTAWYLWPEPWNKIPLRLAPSRATPNACPFKACDHRTDSAYCGCVGDVEHSNAESLLCSDTHESLQTRWKARKHLPPARVWRPCTRPCQ